MQTARSNIMTDFLQSLVMRAGDVDSQSCSDVIRLVAENFVTAFHSSSEQSALPVSAAHLASKEEGCISALQTVLSLYRACRAHPSCPMQAALASQEHHPTTALFMQGALSLAFPDAHPTASAAPCRVGRSGRHLAQEVCLSLVHGVGQPTCRLLLPGVASVSVRFLSKHVPQWHVNKEPVKHISNAAMLLHQILNVCFSKSTSQDGWAGMAITKLMPLFDTLMEPKVLSQAMMSTSSAAPPVAMARSLQELCREFLSIHSRIRKTTPSLPMCSSSVLMSFLFLSDVGGQGPLDQPLSDVDEEGDDVTWESPRSQELEFVIPWDSLLQDMCRSGGSMGGHTWSILKQVMYAALQENTSTIPTTKNTQRCSLWSLLWDEDGEVLWCLLKRLQRRTILSLPPDEQVTLLTSTPKEVPRRHSNVCKGLPELMDEFHTVLGWIGWEYEDIAEALLQRTQDALDDWEEYRFHPPMIFSVSRWWLSGYRPRKGGSASDCRVGLKIFAQRNVFETLWEMINAQHLWCVEVDWEKCSLPQMQHRSFVACTVLAVLRLAADGIADMAAVVADTSAAAPAIRRLILLTVYAVLEKSSSPSAAIHDAAQATIARLAQLACGMHGINAAPCSIQDSTMRFFDEFGRYVTDEAQRAVRDPDLHAGAVRVLTGFTRVMEKTMNCRDKDGSGSDTQGESASSLPQSKQSHRLSIAMFLHDILVIVKDAIVHPHSLASHANNNGGSNAIELRFGSLAVLLCVTSVTGALLMSAPRVFPSDTDWDDNRHTTATENYVQRLQEDLMDCGNVAMAHCLVSNTALAVRCITVMLNIVNLFVGPDNATIIRTQLNLVHRVYLSVEQLLVAPWGMRREEALHMLEHARLCATATAVDSPLHKGGRRTLRSTLLARGRWLADMTVPVEVPIAFRMLKDLLASCPQFLIARMVLDVIPLSLLWYTRSCWMTNISTTRESDTCRAVLEILDAMWTVTSGMKDAEGLQAIRDRCTGIIRQQHWPMLYEEHNNGGEGTACSVGGVEIQNLVGETTAV